MQAINISAAQLNINTVQEVNDNFGQPGDYVVNGKGHVYKINGVDRIPYNSDPAPRTFKHDSLGEGALYGPGRFLVQNKGLVLEATGSPLPDSVEKANETEMTIILAIAMQASTSAVLLPTIDCRPSSSGFLWLLMSDMP